MSKSEKIRQLLDKGLTQKEIHAKTKYSQQLINIVNRNYAKKKKKASKNSQPKSKLMQAVEQTQEGLNRLRLKSSLFDIPATEKKEVDYWVDAATDNVNSPPHYNTGSIETITFIEDKDFNYRLGNVIKYVSRAGKKIGSDPVEDLKKARWYLDREITTRERA
jgi:hypothetical protein